MTTFAAHIKRRALVKTSLAAMLSLAAFQSAHAVGTAAGTDITNTATVNFTVGGVGQTPVNSPAATFKVDRKVNVNVGGGNTTNTTPGSSAVATLFVVTNTGNGTDSFDLGAVGTVNQAGDDFDVTQASIHYYLDVIGSGTVGVYDPGVDTEITTPLSLLADTPRNVFIVADVPLSAANNQNAVVRLTLTSTSTATGVGIPDNPATVEVVIMNQSANNTDTYHVNAAALAVVKSAAVISDPVNGVSANAKAIPGAVIEYSIVVTNSGASSAAAVTLSDNIPTNTTYVAASMTLSGTGVLTDAALDDAGTFTGTAVNVDAGTLAASGGTKTITFRVTINN